MSRLYFCSDVKFFRHMFVQRFVRPTAFACDWSIPQSNTLYFFITTICDGLKEKLPIYFYPQYSFSRTFKVRVEGLKVAFKKSSITLPPQAFRSSQDFSVVTLVYLTLNDVLSLAKETGDKDDQPLSASTTIVSSKVFPKPPDVFKRPVEIVLQNKKVLLSAFKDLSIK